MSASKLSCDFAAQERNILMSCKNDALSIAKDAIHVGQNGQGQFSVQRAWKAVPDSRKKDVRRFVRLSPMSSGNGTDSDVLAYLTRMYECGEDMFLYRLSEMVMSTPSRCGWQERYQFDVLSKQSRLCNDLVDLPAGGKHALYLGRDGRIVPHRSLSSAKSIDFLGRCDIMPDMSAKVAVAAKYTEINGGAQDNQARDLLAFAKSASKYDEIQENGIVIVMLLCDGAYYDRKHANLGITSKLSFRQAVHHDFSDRIVGCTSTGNFDIELNRIIENIRKSIAEV